MKLKVASNQIRRFPFDLIYLVPRKIRKFIPHMFPYGLAMSVSRPVQEGLNTLKVHTVEHQTTRTRFVALNRNDYGSAVTSLSTYVPQIHNYILVVPVFRSFNADEKKYVPAYLQAAVYKHSRNAGLLDDHTVLHTPNGAMRPICRACPRHLLHIKGECTLGESICYQALTLHRDQQPEEDVPEEEADE